MGEGPDPMIVVDSKLRVRGLKNLRYTITTGAYANNPRYCTMYMHGT